MIFGASKKLNQNINSLELKYNTQTVVSATEYKYHGMSLLNYVPHVPHVLRALVPDVPLALRVLLPDVPPVLRALLLHVPGVLRVLVPHVPRALRVPLSHMLRAYVHSCLTCIMHYLISFVTCLVPLMFSCPLYFTSGVSFPICSHASCSFRVSRLFCFNISAF